jgi:adenylate cyclase
MAAVAALAIGRLRFARVIELKAYDQRLRWVADPSTARRDIVLVEIDETSIRRLDPLVGRWPWPRLVHAHLLDYLARAPARAVVYDVLFTEADRRTGFPVGDESWTGAESDGALAEATARSGNVVHLGDATFEGLQGDPRPDGQRPAPATPGSIDSRDVASRFEERPVFTPPYEALARASRVVAHNFLVLDEDGPARRSSPFLRVGERAIPSPGIAAALVSGNFGPDRIRAEDEELSIGPLRLPLVRSTVPGFGPGGESNQARRALINYRGPGVLADGKSTVYPTYSFYELFYSEQQLLGGEAPLVAPSDFRDKVVFVGVTAAGLHDVFASPFGESGKIPGIQLHGNVLDDLVSGRTIRPAGLVPELIGVALPAMTIALAASAASWMLAVAVAGIAIAVTVGASVWLFAGGLWLPLAAPLFGSALGLFGGISYQYFVEGREKRLVKKLFSRYVSRDVYDRLMADPAQARLGGERRYMSVLFSDIRGFTSVSEAGQPEQIVTQLNEYFSCMVQVLFRHHGTVDKFVGDLVMALFGAPLDDPDHADHAVSAALEMVEALEGLNRKWAAEGRPRFESGIGINSGEMVAGNVGSEAIMSYTVIGDAVNLASRLESLNKDYGTRIIISEATRARLRTGYHVRPLGEVVVKGKRQPVAIFEVRPEPVAAPALPQPPAEIGG